MKDIDKYTIELAKSDLNKAMPPKLKYKFMKWLKSMSPKHNDIQGDRRKAINTIKSEIESKINEISARKGLSKSEVMMSTYTDGSIKMDFGSEVPEDVKKAAFAWAKKRGLKAEDASLAKSSNSPSYVSFVPPNCEGERLYEKSAKWDILDNSPF